MNEVLKQPISPAEKVEERRRLLDELEANTELMHDPVMEPYTAQLRNHLKHVSYSFRVAGNTVDYPYDLPHQDPYPDIHTDIALARVDRMLTLAESADIDTKPSIYFRADMGVAARDAQVNSVRRILNDPLGEYKKLQNLRDVSGGYTPMPELGYALKALASDLSNKPAVQEACEKSPMLNKLREYHLGELDEIIKENQYRYKSSLYKIEDLMAFFDLVVRVNEPDSPPPYHSARFEYNWHQLADDRDHILLPTTASLGLTDLIRLRGVPLGMVGVSTSTLTVDGFPQTPYEFFQIGRASCRERVYVLV